MKLYIGIVEDTNDPRKVGRVKIRIPSIHGPGNDLSSTSTVGLPWYEPCTTFHGGYQTGSFVVPPIGAVMWCAEEPVDSGTPFRIYLGGCYGTGSSVSRRIGNNTAPARTLETPTEAISNYPNTPVLYKSLKGSLIYETPSGVLYIKGASGVRIENLLD